jgi:hypothetical protein
MNPMDWMKAAKAKAMTMTKGNKLNSGRPAMVKSKAKKSKAKC